MLDKSVPYYQIFMTKNDISKFDKYELPEGFSFTPYKQGMMIDWVRLQMYYEFFKNYGEAITFFKNVYLNQGSMINTRLIFVKDEHNVIIGSGALWIGTHFGAVMHKIQGIAIHPEFRKKGIAEAIISRLYEIAIELECKGGLYANAATWNYPAINLLFKMGFSAYMGKRPKNHEVTNEEFEENNQLGWGVIMTKINEYNVKHVAEQNDRFGSL